MGASLAGCGTAIFLARLGLTVALVDRRPGVDDYKVACTHFIQASATTTIRRLGLDGAIEVAGGVRNGVELWTRWGWVRPRARTYGPGPSFGYSIRRQTLDPLLRRLAMKTPGVEQMLGRSIERLELETDRARIGLIAPSGHRRTLTARLLVGADGRDSSVAALAGLPVSRSPNHRFVYWAYYRRLPLPAGTRGRFWHLDPAAAYALPNDEGLTLIVAMPRIERLPEFRADRSGAVERFVRTLPEAPSLDDAERASPVLGKLDIANLRRPAAAHRVALVGDAALTCDPLPGVGCGWALQSAEWLADSIAPTLRTNGRLEPSLRAYAARHHAETSHHFAMIRTFSLAKRPKRHERLLVKAATCDEELAARAMALWQRRISVADWLTPSTLARSAAVLGRRRLRRIGLVHD